MPCTHDSTDLQCVVCGHMWLWVCVSAHVRTPRPGQSPSSASACRQQEKRDGGIYNRARAAHPASSPAQFTAVGWGHPFPISPPLLRARDTEKQGLRGRGAPGPSEGLRRRLRSCWPGRASCSSPRAGLCPGRTAQDVNWATAPEAEGQPPGLRAVYCPCPRNPRRSETQAPSRPSCKPTTDHTQPSPL